MSNSQFPLAKGALLLAMISLLVSPGGMAKGAESPWWKGNLHTHTLWSDGDDYPEMIAARYKEEGYHFLMLSDHDILSEGQKWIDVAKSKGREAAFEKYIARFGTEWVEQRLAAEVLMVRLKPLAEFRHLCEEPGRFLMIPGEEISARYKTAPVHVNAVNVRELIKPESGDSVLETLRNSFNAVHEQRQRTGQPMFPFLNHPNFRWAITAEELMQVDNAGFFEVHNGHPQVHNYGDDVHAGTERIWDIVLTHRLEQAASEPLYGIATDDAHNYHTNAIGRSNMGRGWVVVRASHLTPEKIVQAMEAGDFYSSSGVRLKDVRRSSRRLELEIDAEPAFTYTTQFIGTRRGYDSTNEPVRTASGEALRVTHRYSADIGAVLAEVQGAEAAYELQGDEIYVRARVISSKIKPNPYVEGELEMAWTQPLVPPRAVPAADSNQ